MERKYLGAQQGKLNMRGGSLYQQYAGRQEMEQVTSPILLEHSCSSTVQCSTEMLPDCRTSEKSNDNIADKNRHPMTLITITVHVCCHKSARRLGERPPTSTTPPHEAVSCRPLLLPPVGACGHRDLPPGEDKNDGHERVFCGATAGNHSRFTTSSPDVERGAPGSGGYGGI